jgi:hypothetical protein
MKGTLSRAVCFALVLCLISAGFPAQAQDTDAKKPGSSSATAGKVDDLPDSPGSLIAQSSTVSQPSSASPQQPAPTPSGAQSNAQKTQQTEPSGTAVAPPVRVSGGAASKPAGVAIAPPKQRQSRSWLIKFGFIAGAGAALGTVAALSAASPSRVPGSH